MRQVTLTIPQTLWEWAFNTYGAAVAPDIMLLVALRRAHRHAFLRTVVYVGLAMPTAIYFIPRLTPEAYVPVATILFLMVVVGYVHRSDTAMRTFAAAMGRLYAQDNAQWSDICADMDRLFGPAPWRARRGDRTRDVAVPPLVPDA